MTDQNEHAAQKAKTNLQRIHSALGSSALSDSTIASHAGKSALAALLAESLDGDVRVDVAHNTIKKALRLG